MKVMSRRRPVGSMGDAGGGRLDLGKESKGTEEGGARGGRLAMRPSIVLDGGGDWRGAGDGLISPWNNDPDVPQIKGFVDGLDTNSYHYFILVDSAIGKVIRPSLSCFTSKSDNRRVRPFRQ